MVTSGIVSPTFTSGAEDILRAVATRGRALDTVDVSNAGGENPLAIEPMTARVRRRVMLRTAIVLNCVKQSRKIRPAVKRYRIASVVLDDDEEMSEQVTQFFFPQESLPPCRLL